MDAADYLAVKFKNPLFARALTSVGRRVSTPDTDNFYVNILPRMDGYLWSELQECVNILFEYPGSPIIFFEYPVSDVSPAVGNAWAVSH